MDGTTNGHTESAPRRVVVVGAGPCGCLAAHLLLMRKAGYHVTLVDGRPDPTSVPLAQQRSWMIGLTAHGLAALDRVPGLHNTLQSVWVPLKGGRAFLGRWALDADSSGGYIVDRNWVVNGLVRHLQEHNFHSKRLTCRWNTRCLYVDPAARTVTVQTADGTPTALPYDLCLGCDGIRSIVRNAFLQDRSFEMELTDVFSVFKSVHLPRPSTIDPAYVYTAFTATPNMMFIFIPERGDVTNMAGAYQRNKPCDPALASKDPAVVEAYMRTHFNAPVTLDWKLFGELWAAAEWNTTGQVKCSTYHLPAGRCLLLGDAAHATNPSIGQGMNTAFQDAVTLDTLLDEFDDDLDKVLPAFTARRLKEGHALVELSAHSICGDVATQVTLMLWAAGQTLAHRLTLGLVPQYPVTRLSYGAALSEAYRDLTLHGPLAHSRATNADLRRRYFEEQSGLIPPQYRRESTIGLVTGTVAHLLAAGAAVTRAIMLTALLPLRLTGYFLRAVSP
eukprot:TRINITY_DN1414_c0_g1_i2.p1 TRINITY_DN1414_c0_g1~~TRINITY_DN1414_c0_g1_i2.p1  ORF type:complete len:510 (-),score=150.67 TRINITY_DN1414_c0_g1_i2:147-1655(-)